MNREIDNYLLYKNLPSIDIHGEDRVGAKIKIEVFIKENYILKNKFLLIIHGKGTGTLKNTTKKVLKENKLVKDYKLDIFNPGVTIVELKQEH